MSKSGIGNCLFQFSLQVCVRAPILSRLFVDGHHVLRYFLPLLLPALLQITALLLGTVGQKVHPSLSCPVSDWCKPIFVTSLMLRSKTLS